MHTAQSWGRGLLMTLFIIAVGGAAMMAQQTEVVPAPEAAAAAAPAVELPAINSGSTAWMITATALVVLMTVPGLALFYSGMVRKKNVLATLMQVFATFAVISIVWMVIGYSLAFTDGSVWVGGLDRFLLTGLGVDSDRSGCRR